MTKLKNFFMRIFREIFGTNIPLEHFVFLCVAFAGIFMAAVGIVGNASLNLSAISLVTPALFIVVDVGCILWSIRTKRWQWPAYITLGSSIFMLFPSLWFTTGGATGSTLSLLVTSGLCVVIIFKGIARSFILVADLAMCLSFIVAEYLVPDIFIPYPTRFAWYTDLIIGITLSFTVNAALAYLVMRRYEKARRDETSLARQLELLSLTDPLCGVYNRRYLTACVDEEMRKCYDDGTNLCICILDLDHFKSVNDTFGHNFGDEVLVAVTQTVLSCLEKKDVFGRYGGEEFLVVFRDRSLPEAKEKAQEIRRAVKRIRWPNGAHITLSCGVSSYIKGISLSAFIENADRNLYKAKNSGRDRVV